MNDRFTLSAQVLLTRRLNNLLRIDETVEIDMDYVTCAEYQLFIDFQQAQGQHVQPDHWTANRFLPGTAKQPITGIRGSDAVDFCEWLTQQQLAPSFRYRIPTLPEIEEHTATLQTLGCWCGDSERLSFGGLSEQQLQLSLLSTKEFMERKGLERSNQAIDVNLDIIRALDGINTLDRALDRARALDGDLDRALARDLARASDRARASDLTLDRSLARALDRAHGLTSALDSGHASALAHDLDRARALARALAHDLAIIRVSASTHDFGHTSALDRILDRARDLAHDLAIIRVSASAHARAYDRSALTLARASDCARDLARALANALAHARALDSDRAIPLAFSDARARNDAFNLGYAHQIIRNQMFRLTTSLDKFTDSFNLLDKAGNFAQRLNRSRYLDDVKKYVTYSDQAAQLYTFFALLELRRQGKISAWEGIRIVRERIDD